MKKLLMTILLLVSANSNAFSFNEIEGAYLGGSRAGSGDCQINISDDGNGYATFEIYKSGKAIVSPKIKITAIDNLLSENEYNRLSLELPQKALSLRQSETWYVEAQIFDSGMLNFARVKHTIKQRQCIGFNCIVSDEDFSCPVKLND